MTRAAQTLMDRFLYTRTQQSFDQNLAQARSEGIQGVLSYYLAHQPGPHRQQARQYYQQEFFLNSRLLELLHRTVAALQQQQIPVLLLKGVALIGPIYSPLGVRPLSDIDILIAPAHHQQAHHCLLQIGYAHQNGLNYHWQGLALDLHLDLNSAYRIRARADLYRFHLDDMWSTATQRADIPGAYCLANEDQFLYLACHALKHAHNRLIWLLDLAELFPHCDPRRLDQRARATSTTRPLAYALNLLKELWYPQLVAPACNWIEKLYLQKVARRQNLEPLLPFFMAATLDSWPLRMSYLWEMLLPRTEVLEQMYPGQSGWRLYRSRLVSLAKKLPAIYSGIGGPKRSATRTSRSSANSGATFSPSEIRRIER